MKFLKPCVINVVFSEWASASKMCIGTDCIIGLIQSLAEKYGQKKSKILRVSMD